MKRILCVDNSESTSGCVSYWNVVAQTHYNLQPCRLIYWNSTAVEMSEFHQYSSGGTAPQCFIHLLEQENEPFELHITTDGEIYEGDMTKCGNLVTAQLLTLINSTKIYYIGNEGSMNIGLNVIFGRTKSISYYINDRHFDLYDNFDKLDIDEFMSPNFAISLIVRIKNIEAIYLNQTTREAKLSELRGEVCRLFSKLEHESLDTVGDNLETYSKNNEIEKFMAVLAKDRLDVGAVNRQKSTTLNMFDRKIDFNISRINAAVPIKKQDIEVPDEEVTAWSEFEDDITKDKFNLPCLLVQNTDAPVITDNNILKHPLKILSEPELIKKIMLLIEPNLIDYTTYERLEYDKRGYTKSPHTRVACKGVFIIDAPDMKCVKNNCRSISVLFGNDNKVPGNLVIWNLVIMYLLHKYKFNESEYKNVIRDEIKSYCTRFSANLTFTHQCLVLRREKLEICLWYCIQAAPMACPNTAKNVLRSPFGLDLLELYSDIFGSDNDEYLTELTRRTKKWAVWNYLLKNKHRRDLFLEVMAQYQNYCIHNDNIIPLAGKCETPYKSICNIIDADDVNTLFVNLTYHSTKNDNIDAFDMQPATINYDDKDGISESITHVKINIKTCWPLVICPVTKLHWRDCIGDYDIKKQSLFRLFNSYCCKYKNYPSNHMDLVLLFSKKNKDIVIRKFDINEFQYVCGVFKEVMTTYTCEEYLKIYNTHTDEKLRLSKE